MLIEAVAALFMTKPAAEWAALLDDADCCFSRVVAPADLLNDPQVRARAMVGMSDSGVPWMRSPIRLVEDEIEIREAPEYGEHTTEVLSDVGYPESEIVQLMSQGIIRQAP